MVLGRSMQSDIENTRKQLPKKISTVVNLKTKPKSAKQEIQAIIKPKTLVGLKKSRMGIKEPIPEVDESQIDSTYRNDEPEHVSATYGATLKLQEAFAFESHSKAKMLDDVDSDYSDQVHQQVKSMARRTGHQLMHDFKARLHLNVLVDGSNQAVAAVV